MKNAVIASGILHLLILVLFGMSIGNPFQKTLKDQQPIVVDFVRIDDKSAAPKLSPMNKKMEDLPKPEPVEEKKPEEPKVPELTESHAQEKELPPPPPEEPKKPEEKPIEKPKEVEPPKKEEAPVLKKKEPEKKKPEKKPEPPKKPEKKADKKPEKKKEEKKKDAKKKDKKKPADKAEVNLRKNKASDKNKKPDPKAKKSAKSSLDDLLKEVNDESGEEGAPAETVGEVVTATQIDAIRQKIRKCWFVPAGLKGAKDMVVDIKMEIGRDGTVTKADIVDKGRMAQDSGFRTAAENARRAVLDPQCNPLPLPADKYDQWKDLEMSFNPKDMF